MVVAHRDLILKITDKVHAHIDFDRELIVMLCNTDDGKSLHLEAGYQTINKIRSEIDKQLDRL